MTKSPGITRSLPEISLYNLKFLTPRDQKLVSMYFGLNGKPMTYAEIANEFEIDRRTISKYTKVAIQRLIKIS